MSDDPNDLDLLMELDPLELASRPGGIEAVITYHRKQRARRAAGEKPVRDTAGPKVDMTKIMGNMLKPKAEVPIVKRRV